MTTAVRLIFLIALQPFYGLQRHESLAEWTGLEPATPGVTGRYSNQLNYHSWQAAFCLHSSTQAKCYKLGDPTGIRTPVLTVKG